MKITIHNYEAYFLDFREGTLTATLENELHRFLKAYPELKSELEDYEPGHPTPKTVLFPFKNNLKRRLFTEDQVIEYIEGTLNPRDMGEMEALAKDSEDFARHFNSYKNTILQPPLIPFPNKSKLRQPRVFYFFQSQPLFIKAAAVLAPLAFFFWLVRLLILHEVSGNSFSEKQSSNKMLVLHHAVAAYHQDTALPAPTFEFKINKDLISKKPKRIKEVLRKNIGKHPEEVPNAKGNSVEHQEVTSKKEDFLKLQNEIENRDTMQRVIFVQNRNSSFNRNAMEGHLRKHHTALFAFGVKVSKLLHFMGIRKTGYSESNETGAIQIGQLAITEKARNYY